jgi:hypothetical protein
LLAGGEFLGLTPARVWEMTPRYFHAIWKHFIAAEERQQRRTAMICASVYNAFGAKKQNGDTFSVEDFMPSDKPTQSTRRRRPTAAELQTGIATAPVSEDREQDIQYQIDALKAFTQVWNAHARPH